MNIHSPHRAALFRLLTLLSIHSSTQDDDLLVALQFVREYQHARRDYLPAEIDLEFASQR